MIVSDARIAANRANAQKSTGPKTAEGKERSRCNAVKHGLTGEGVALCSEDAAEIERRFLGLQAEFRPRTEGGRTLVKRVAMLSVRLERSAVHEAAAISKNVRAAVSDFDEARETAVDELFASLAENPGPALRRLARTPEGVERMVDAWMDLREDLKFADGSRWTAEHVAMAVNLSGRKSGGFGVARPEALGRAALGDFSLLDAGEGAGLDPKDRRSWARGMMVGLIETEARKLLAHRETLDFEAIEADRDSSPARALFDASKEACLARKYEAAAAREMYRALRDLRAIEAEAADRPAAETLYPHPPAREMGSSSPTPLARAVPDAPTPAGDRFAPADASTFIPMTIGRPDPARS